MRPEVWTARTGSRGIAMRLGLIIAGVIIAAIGAAVALGRIEYRTNVTVLQVGDLKASVPHDRTVPPWLGVAALVIGAGLVVAGVSRKS